MVSLVRYLLNRTSGLYNINSVAVVAVVAAAAAAAAVDDEFGLRS